MITKIENENYLYRKFNIGFKDGFRDEVESVLLFFEKFVFPYVINPSSENQDLLNAEFNKLPYKTDIICSYIDIRKGDFTCKE